MRQFTGLAAHIKWPNDLLVERRKLAGILAEAVDGRPETRNVVLGYGINVGRMSYPRELEISRDVARKRAGPRHRSRGALRRHARGLARRYDDLLAGRFDAILDAWRAARRRSRGARVAWDAHGRQRSPA